MTRGSNPSLLILEMEGRERLFHRGVLPVLKRVDGTSCSTWGPPWLPKCGTLCQAGSESSGKWCQDLLNYEQSGHFDGVQPQRNTRQRPRPNCAGTSHVRALQTSKMSPGRTWTREHQQVDGDVGARVQETHTSRMQRGEL